MVSRETWNATNSKPARAVSTAIIMAAALPLQACNKPIPAPHQRVAVAPDSIVALPGTAVMMAAKGTVGRELIDWLATHDKQPQRFELGGQEFVGRAVEPTIESKVRIARLATMLNAYPDVTVHVIGYTDTSGDDAADMSLSNVRAERVVQALHDEGMSRSRLSSEGRGGADPIAANRSESGRAINQRVALVLAVQH